MSLEISLSSEEFQRLQNSRHSSSDSQGRKKKSFLVKGSGRLVRRVPRLWLGSFPPTDSVVLLWHFAVASAMTGQTVSSPTMLTGDSYIPPLLTPIVTVCGKSFVAASRMCMHIFEYV